MCHYGLVLEALCLVVSAAVNACTFQALTTPCTVDTLASHASKALKRRCSQQMAVHAKMYTMAQRVVAIR